MMVAASLKKHAWLPKAEAEIMAAEAIYKLTSMESAKGIIIGNDMAAMPQKLPTTLICFTLKEGISHEKTNQNRGRRTCGVR